MFHSNFTKWPHWNEVSMDWSVSLFLRKRLQRSVLILPIYRRIIWVLTWVWINSWQTHKWLLCWHIYAPCFFLLRASDWSSNVQRRKCRISPFTSNCPITSAPWVWLFLFINWVKLSIHFLMRGVNISDERCIHLRNKFKFWSVHEKWTIHSLHAEMHSGKSASIRESNHSSGVYKEHYA